MSPTNAPPTNAPDAALQAKLDALRQAFIGKLPGMLAPLDEAVHAYRDAAEAEARTDALAAINRHAHKIAGTAGTYGLSAIATPLREMEKKAQGETPPEAETFADLLAEAQAQLPAQSPVESDSQT